MATYELSVRDDGYPAFSFENQLDGEYYELDFQWNEREGFWYVSISDENEDLIVSGTKCVVDWDLLKGVADTRRPPGSLVALDPTGQGQEGGLVDMGHRLIILYTDEADL